MKLLQGEGITCLVNPSLGKEYLEQQEKVKTPKNVMVIGAGPGGLQAALTAAKRGHKVRIYEQRDDIGGQFKSAAYPPCKGELATYTAWIRNQLLQAGVAIQLNTKVDAMLIEELQPDSIVLATGGTPIRPNIPGIHKAHVVSAEDVLLGKIPTSDQIVICGGGEVGEETAAALAMEEKAVSVVEMTPTILRELDPIQTIELTNILNKYGVRQYTSTKVVEITDDSVICERGTEKLEIPAETVVIAFGYQPNHELEESAKKLCGEVYVIGGAVKTSNALNAIQDGYQTGLKI